MRSIKKLLWLLPLIAMLVALVPFAVIADGESASGVTDGWSIDEDGVQRYYTAGEYATGVKVIGGYTFEFAEDGAYLGLYDNHTNVGTLDTNEGDAFVDALKAIKNSGKKIYSYHNFNHLQVGNTYNGNIASTNKDLPNNNFLVVQRDTQFLNVERGDGIAIHVKGSETATTHSYVDGLISGHKPGESIVIEFDFMLGEDYNHTSSVQLIDRSNKDTGANVFFNVMTINKEGGLYLAVDSSKLVALLTPDEFTRVSLAFHPLANTMDVYVNGLLVYPGAPFVTASDYTAQNLQIEAVRAAQFSGAVKLGSMYIDNFAAYQATEPVCTVTAENKSGIFLEGSVLRLYRDNCIVLGTASVTGTAGDYTFDGEKLKFSSLDGSYYPGNNAEIIINGVVSSSGTVPGNIFTVPAAVTPDNGVFGGWQIVDNGKSVLASPGEIYVMNGDITCTAAEMDFEVLKGASISTAAGDGNSLRFMAKIDSASYNGLINAGAKIETHMLIVPSEFFEKTYGYHTVESLNMSGFEGQYIDLTATSWYATNDRYNYYVGTVDNIPAADFAKKYSAVAYMIITYPNGTENVVYAPFCEEDNTRTVYQVAHAAYNDRTTLKDQESYGNKIKFGKLNTFSPYTAEKLGVIKTAADSVIALDASGKEVVPAGAFYDAPYTAVTSFNSETGKNDIAVSSKDEGWSLSQALGVVYNGKELSADEYTIDAVCALSVDALSYDIGGMHTAPDEVSSWILIDPYFDYSRFEDPTYGGGLVTDERFVQPGTEVPAALHWSYYRSQIAFAPADAQELGSRLDGSISAYKSVFEDGTYYYDFSDWQAISFYVYSDTADQTFQFNFGSENPVNGKESDYYGKNFKLQKGWNYFSVTKDSFGASRTPLGWDRITAINITNSGWNQNPTKTANLYFSEFRVYDSKDVGSPFSDSRFQDAAIFSENGIYCGVDGNTVNVSDGDEEALVFIKDGVYYLPLASVASVKAEFGTYYPDEGVLNFYYNSEDYIFTAGSKTYTVNGEVRELTTAPIVKGRALFFADADVMTIFGYTQKYVDRMGFIALSNTENILDPKADFDFIYDLIECMVYVRPSGEQMVEDLNANTNGGQHPYLMVDGEGFDRLRYYAEMDATMQFYIQKLEASYGIGTSRFTSNVNRYGLTDGQRLLSISRDVMNKTVSWALLAKLYEVSDPERSAQYAERIWLELEAAANFKDSGVYYYTQRILTNKFKVSSAKAVLTSKLSDIGIKGDKLTQFIDACEKEFKLSISSSVVSTFVTVGDVCNYLDENVDGKYSWHPAHFLDTGELGYPFGICYDWLYDYWVKTNDNINVQSSANNQTLDYGYPEGTTRLSILEDAMFYMGLSATNALPSVTVHPNDTDRKYIEGGYGLGGSANNWNGVCNGGLMAAALSIANVDRFADDIKTYLSATIQGVETGMWVYAPDGGYEEGPGYWSYGTTYLQVFMSCLNSACGTNYGLYNAPGFAHSVYFTTYLGTKNTTWGFHDGGSGSADTNIAAWFAKESNDPNVNAIRRQAIENGWKGVSMYDIMYFDPHIMTSTITLELDSYYSLDTIMTFRSSWDAGDCIFTGLHGGDNAASHGDLDMGNFIINVNGTFMFCDLGSDSYNMPGYFGCYRWSYYRKRAEGQNTLVMVPSSTNTKDEGWNGKTGIPALKPGGEPSNTQAGTNQPIPDHIASAVSKALRYESGKNSALGVVEMHPAFNEMTEGVRGLWFKDNRSTIVLQDEAVMSEDMDIWWFAHTQNAEITVSKDGRSAIVQRNGIYLYCEIVTDMPEEAKFTVMDAVSLDKNYTGWTVSSGYYTGDVEGNRDSFKKLTVRVDDCSELRLAVVFKVIESPAAAPELGTIYQWTDIADWKVD